MLSKECDSKFIKSLSKAFSKVVISSKDAEEIFRNVEKRHIEFQKQLKASVLSCKDKERIYTL